MPTISIICAVYNAEKTIKRCINSILSQSFSNFELLLINDGSTDESGRICDEYARKDSRIRVIHKINEGVAATRQLGLDLSQGEFMIHVDPDDWIEENTLQLLYNSLMTEKSLIAICDYNLISKENVKHINQKPDEMNSLSMMEGILSGRLLGGVCNKLIHSMLYKNGGVNLIRE